MGKESKAEPQPATKEAKETAFEKLVAEFQQIHEPDKRKAFYHAHPELRQLYSPVNFH